jgi:hypothetical protein
MFGNFFKYERNVDVKNVQEHDFWLKKGSKYDYVKQANIKNTLIICIFFFTFYVYCL